MCATFMPMRFVISGEVEEAVLIDLSAALEVTGGIALGVTDASAAALVRGKLRHDKYFTRSE